MPDNKEEIREAEPPRPRLSREDGRAWILAGEFINAFMPVFGLWLPLAERKADDSLADLMNAFAPFLKAYAEADTPEMFQTATAFEAAYVHYLKVSTASVMEELAEIERCGKRLVSAIAIAVGASR